MAPFSTFDLLERLGNLLRGDLRRAGAHDDLEPVHLQALDYLPRANAYSNTPLGVSDYLGLAKGNVSQRLIALERKGYLKRTGDAADGRVSHLVLSAKGRALLRAHVPPPAWREALESMPEQRRSALDQSLFELLRALQTAHELRSFGVCRTCRFFTPEGDRFRCGLTREPLARVRLLDTKRPTWNIWVIAAKTPLRSLAFAVGKSESMPVRREFTRLSPPRQTTLSDPFLCLVRRARNQRVRLGEIKWGHRQGAKRRCQMHVDGLR